MRDGRPDDERRTVGTRALERHRRLALLEDRELALRHRLAGRESALTDRDPRNDMTRGARVDPAFAGFQRDQQIVDPIWRADRTPRVLVVTHNEMSGPNARHAIGSDVLRLR